MAEKQTQTITINDKEYTEDQLTVGRQVFVDILNASINSNNMD